MHAHDKHTGGFTSPAGIGCGATGAAGAEGVVSAQNQPMIKCSTEEELDREKEAMEGICCWPARGGGSRGTKDLEQGPRRHSSRNALSNCRAPIGSLLLNV